MSSDEKVMFQSINAELKKIFNNINDLEKGLSSRDWMTLCAIRESCENIHNVCTQELEK